MTMERLLVAATAIALLTTPAVAARSAGMNAPKIARVIRPGMNGPKKKTLQTSLHANKF
jgi:uncharacterized protein YdeI (BOF family)